MSQPLGICVLAAGKGTRMKSLKPKVLQPLAGAPMLEYVLDAVAGLNPTTCVVVVGYEADRVAKVATAERRDGFHARITVVKQEPQLGTGHALQQAMPALAELAQARGTLVVVLGDVPLIQTETIERLLRHHRQQTAAVTMLSMLREQPTGYGRVLRAGDGTLVGVREEKDATPAEREIKEVNTGLFAFDVDALVAVLPKLTNTNQSGEFYLPDVIPLLEAAKKRCHAVVAQNSEEVSGVNTFDELARADRILRDRILFTHMRDGGVHIVDPVTTYIEKDVTIGHDTTILPFTVIRRGVQIGAGCEVGPFAHLRAGTVLADTAEIGNFVETKKAKIGKHSKAKHLAYLGDVTMGDGCNIGAGTITCNYDGKNKHSTIIGNEVFIGSDTMIVAPRTIGDHARTGAGAVVTKDVPPGTTVVGIPARPVPKHATRRP